MDGSTDNILEKIKQYQKSILKHSELRNDAKILSYISKLYEMPVTVAHLQDTGIGRTINSLRKYNGDVGTASKAIVYKWKNMVAREEEAEEAALEAASRQSQSSVDESENTPPPTPPNVDRKKRKHSTEDKDKKKSHEKRHKRESPERRSKSKERENESRNKSHHRKDEKRDSHKSSHSHSKVKEVSDRHRKEDKSKHDKKRKLEDERSPAKKKKYEDSDSDESNRLLIQENSLDSTVLSDDNVQPAQENSRENTQSPDESTSSSPRKKSNKSNNRDKVSSKKEQNGSKVSSHRDKPIDSKKVQEAKSSSSKEKNKESPKKPKPAVKSTTILHGDNNGIDSGSGASFAEALGMITPSSSKGVFKKKNLSSSPTPSTSSTTVIKPAKPMKSPSSSVAPSPSQNVNVDLLAPNTKLEPLDLNIIPPIPEITTNYKPLTATNYTYDSFASKIKNMTEDEALCAVISSKTQRTKVYSGNKTNCGFVPSLFQICVRVLQDNIDALEYTGGVPYEILKPVLERATANQLLNTEYFNPYLIEESGILWEKHCKRECRGQHKQELESWRDMYLRCRDEREAKLKTLTTNIKQAIDKSVPVRQTKLAYVDNAKPPRNIARKQAKYGTNAVAKPFMTPTARLNAIASGSGEKIHVPAPARVSTATIKPKKAPLMQKTLALIKSRFRR